MASSSSIPNLNTLRPPRGSGRGRGSRLRGGTANREYGPLSDHSWPISSELAPGARDSVVQATDNDASSSRLSAVDLGYLADDFVRAFLPAGQPVAKRYPIINRGTYIRTTAIDFLVRRFLAKSPDPFLANPENQRKQVVSLGAGSDTRFWRLCGRSGSSPPPCRNVDYYELDFEQNVASKRARLQESFPLKAATQSAAEENSSTYHLHALDLRDLASSPPPQNPIPGLDPSLPTLLISECCLCYLEPETAEKIISYFTTFISSPITIALILYEPIRPTDAFGRTMLTNLASRNIHLPTLPIYPTLKAQRRRLEKAGFADGQGARDVGDLYADDVLVGDDERRRVESLEWLDEVEEWVLLARHYCVAWAWRGVEGEVWRDLMAWGGPAEEGEGVG